MERHPFKKSLDSRDGICDVDGDASAAEGSVADVQVPRGLWKNRIHP
jgi:hypothetical protein